MAKKPVLVVMAAGMGSRYGGLKQIDPVGSHGEAILDYSVYDAHEAGFETIVIIIKEAIKKDFIVEWSIGNKSYWINVEDSEDGQEIYIVININHPFFKPYTNNEDFKIVLEKFVISFVVAEQQAKLTSDKDGYIRASTIRHKMNEFLSKVSED